MKFSFSAVSQSLEFDSSRFQGVGFVTLLCILVVLKLKVEATNLSIGPKESEIENGYLYSMIHSNLFESFSLCIYAYFV